MDPKNKKRLGGWGCFTGVAMACRVYDLREFKAVYEDDLLTLDILMNF